MNPSPWQLAMMSDTRNQAQAIARSRQAELHRRAVTKRRKAKRGGER